MTVRNTMTALIAEVSLLVGDTSNAVLSTQQVQDALDRTREEYVFMALTPITTRSATATSYLNYVAEAAEMPLGDWETDGVIQDGAFNTLSPATSDWLVGKWTFSTSQTPPVYLSGHTYDRYAAAADLLEKYAATAHQKFDAKDKTVSVTRSQMFDSPLRLARHYRTLQRPRAVMGERSDVTP